MTKLRLTLLVSTFAFLLASCGGAGKKSAEMKSGPAQYKVRMATTKGDILLLVHRDWAPLGADHFYELTKMGFYDENRFFRTVPGFIIQWGVNGDPKINKDWSEIQIHDDPQRVSNKVGTVVFASAGPNSRTTQLFINLGDNSASLDQQGFTPFGEVIQGMDNVLHIDMEYGEQPSQAAIADIGNPYLEEHFPRLDYIKKTSIEP